MLFGLTPTVTGTIISYLLIGIFGVSQGSLLLLTSLMFTQYYIVNPNIVSSYKQDNQVIQNDIEKGLQSLVILTLPLIYHVGMFYRNFFDYYNLSNFFGTLCFAILYLRYTERFELINLLYPGARRLDADKQKRIGNVIALFFIGVLILLFEYRVIFGRFYYSIRLPSPFNYIFVTLGLYSFYFLFIILIHSTQSPLFHSTSSNSLLSSTFNFSSSSKDNQSKLLVLEMICYVIGFVSSISIGFAIGMSVLTVPFIVAPCIFFIRFYFNKKSLDYLIFSLSSLAFLSWFVFKSFWFLTFDFSGIPIQSFSFFLLILSAFAIFIPASIFSSQRGYFIALYSFFLAFVENIVYFDPLGLCLFLFYLFPLSLSLSLSLSLLVASHFFLPSFPFSAFCVLPLFPPGFL